MPISNSYYENICFEQSQFNNFEDCSTIDEILNRYRSTLWTEHKFGVEIDPSEPEYFLEFVKVADDLIQAWRESYDEEIFLKKAEAISQECLEIAEIIINGELCDLCF